MNLYYIGIDIGGTFFRIGAVDSSYNIINYSIVKSNIFTNNINTMEDVLKNEIKQFIEANDFGQLKGISIGIPGIVSKGRDQIISVPNLKGFNNINIVENLKEFFDVPIFLQNDVEALLIYDIYKNSLVNNDSVIGFYVGTGIGNAIYVNGNIWRGHNGAAAELGHIPLYGKKDKCICGNNGCIELYSSGNTLNEIQKKYFSDTDYNDLFVIHAKDQILLDFIKNIALGISIEINILDPESIILGGGVISMKQFPIELLKIMIIDSVRKPYPANNLKFIKGGDEKYAGIIGAVYNMMH